MCNHSISQSINSSNCTFVVSTDSPQTVGFIVFNLFFFIVVIIPVVVLNVGIIVALFREKTTAKSIRFVLANILSGCVIVATGLAMFHITGVHLAVSGSDPPNSILCRFIIIVIALGGAVRLLFMTTFSITVFVIVKYRRAMMYWLSIVTAVILWVFAVIGASPISSESLVDAHFGGGLACGPVTMSVLSVAYAILYVLIYGGVCTGVTITFLLMTVCYIRKKTVADREISKGLIKLGFFLLLGNFISLCGQVVPALIAALITTEEEMNTKNYMHSMELAYVGYTLMDVSLIPPIILVMVYFDPLRKSLLSCFSKVHRRRSSVSHPSVTTNKTQLSGTSKDAANNM